MKSVVGAGVAVLALAAVNSAFCAAQKPKPIFETGTEKSARGLTLPPPEIVNAVLRSMDKEDVREMDQCVEDQNLTPLAYQKLFRSAVFRPSPTHTLYFVRGSENYCSALYGAHGFQYFLVDESSASGQKAIKIVFKNRGDNFAIYPEIAHGLNDIETGGCIATECSSARMSFDGQKYRTVTCSVTTFGDDGRQITKPRRCGADGFKDDQSSGFAPRSNKQAASATQP